MADPDNFRVHSIDHIKKLPDADKARAILEECARHIRPLLQARRFPQPRCSVRSAFASARDRAATASQARRWRVLKLYEICCCTAGGKNLGVGGFCCPAGDGVTSLRIAIRLRTPGHGPQADEWGAHSLRDLDHAMKVLIHEVSHIVHGNHSAAFYTLMAELTRQYETYLQKGQVLDEAGMPLTGGRKADASRHNPSLREARLAALGAAEARARTGAILGGGGRLGGGGDVCEYGPQ
ncbi:hypothetical protein EMIHUDRAFT_242171 [Emiliania huxleyi CCMP1516]|uniref:WLM domain-containing protein n=2 Tax=Emiliania huxleyi TaxID=2903 RepID=A0A0D3J9V5_EMIH1|nr:hypothetical protein EMIHUDRAFT_242171 [Emiliania huxleyi CCMP1516]EOD20290.1 hypothetical protein EMIHUDRAFT_242171 [Emiliania huxleyi CCMP1516]|eukprot:XP_005772719.1 hypothetical protein EMIHUDRAFT_242171 [Emiliania huxleyi CCMP1516]